MARQRTLQFMVRVTPEEAQIIQAHAANAETTVAAYMRDRALSLPMDEALLPLVNEYARGTGLEPAEVVEAVLREFFAQELARGQVYPDAPRTYDLFAKEGSGPADWQLPRGAEALAARVKAAVRRLRRQDRKTVAEREAARAAEDERHEPNEG